MSKVYTSPDEIALALGMKSFAEHEYDVLCKLGDHEKQYQYTREFAIKSRFRRTGRTTKILFKALCVVSCGNPVFFSAHRFGMRRIMVTDAREYAAQLGLDITLIEPSMDRAKFCNMRPQTFFDHEIYE